MHTRAKTLIALIAAALLPACASMPTTTYNRASSTVKTVAVAPIGMPEKAEVRILNSVGGNFGLIGAIVEESRAANARDELVAVFEKTGFDHKQAISAAILDSMKQAGFEVQPLDIKRDDKERTKFLKAVPDSASADAVLDTYVQYVGFLAAGSSTDYLPAFECAVRLVDAKTKKVLFQDQFVYAQSRPTYQKAIVVPSISDDKFANREALQLDATATRDALNRAITGVAAELGKQFQ